jgi:hypothetical protein
VTAKRADTLTRMTRPTFDELDQLSTEELRDRAFARAEKHRDIHFFWDLIKHLPASSAIETEDGSLGGVSFSIAETVELARELLSNRDYGASEPLIRARFIDYVMKHPD